MFIYLSKDTNFRSCISQQAPIFTQFLSTYSRYSYCNTTPIGIASEPDCRKCGMKEETYVRETTLLLPEEQVMKEPLWKIRVALFASETELLNWATGVEQWAKPKYLVS